MFPCQRRQASGDRGPREFQCVRFAVLLLITNFFAHEGNPDLVWACGESRTLLAESGSAGLQGREGFCREPLTACQEGTTGTRSIL